MNWNLFTSTYLLIFLAELPDKTAFATLTLAGEGRTFPLFLGAALAFLVQTSVAIGVGSLFARIDPFWIKCASSALFFFFAYQSFQKSRHSEGLAQADPVQNPKTGWATFLQAFIMIFVAEWGDLTQLATASLSAKYDDRVTVFLASLLALWSVTGIALGAGKILHSKMNPRFFNRLVATVLGMTGFYFATEALNR